MPSPPLLVVILGALCLAGATYGNLQLLRGKISVHTAWAQYVFPSGAAVVVILAGWSLYLNLWAGTPTFSVSFIVLGLCALLFAAKASIAALPAGIKHRRAPWADR